MGHRIRKEKRNDVLSKLWKKPWEFGYGVISLYEIEKLYGQRLSLAAKNIRLEKENKKLKKKIEKLSKHGT